MDVCQSSGDGTALGEGDAKHEGASREEEFSQRVKGFGALASAQGEVMRSRRRWYWLALVAALCIVSGSVSADLLMGQRTGKWKAAHNAKVKPKATPQWSRNYEKCVGCGRVDRKFYAKGMCRACYYQTRYGSPPAAPAQTSVAVPSSPDSDLEARRQRYAVDYRAFWQELICPNLPEEGIVPQNWGKLHDLAVDFMNIGEPANVVRYTKLESYLPVKVDGEYPERWLYWPMLASEPEIQDGPVGPLSRMLVEKFWHGVVIRVRGDGRTKAELLPRGHLKTEIITKGMTLWRIVRAPLDRHIIKSATSPVASKFCTDIAGPFSTNDKFRELYGHLGPCPKRQGPWSTEELQVYTGAPRSSDTKWQSIGREPTVSVSGMESNNTGFHGEHLVFDDIVGFSNFQGVALQRTIAGSENMEAIRDPGATVDYVGTMWDPQDASQTYIAGAAADHTCFMIATCLDADQTAPAPKALTPLGFGKPIWPEVFSIRTLERKRSRMRNDRFWYGQEFNQMNTATMKPFSLSWLTEYQGTPLDAVRSHKLNIFGGFDTASGAQQQKGYLDMTAGWFFGQTQDRPYRYFWLDGFQEQLTANQILDAIVTMCCYWRDVARQNSTAFTVAFEKTAYTNFLGPGLEMLQRLRGETSIFPFKLLVHTTLSKPERIRILARPYSDRRVYWPTMLTKAPVAGGEPYDLLAIARDMTAQYPSVRKPDLLDAEAMAYELCYPDEFKSDGRAEEVRAHGTYWRERLTDDEQREGVRYEAAGSQVGYEG